MLIIFFINVNIYLDIYIIKIYCKFYKKNINYLMSYGQICIKNKLKHA